MKRASKKVRKGTEGGDGPPPVNRVAEGIDAAQASPAPAAQSPPTPAQSTAVSSAEKSAIAAQVPKPAGLTPVSVSFLLLDLGAKKVSLCGDFNRWTSDATPMKRGKDGLWETSVALAPGRYEYKFIVDGHWIPDPRATEHVWNRHGTLNSVIEVRS